jgi:hypothetical protein
VAPIPPFLIYDGIDQDLDAADVYKWVLGVDDYTTAMFSHLKSFLLAILTGHNAPDHWPTIPSTELFAPPPVAANSWARKKFAKVYPALVPMVPSTNSNVACSNLINDMT